MGLRPKKHRLSMDIPDDMWEDLKKLIELHNTTITKFILQTLCRRIAEQKNYE